MIPRNKGEKYLKKFPRFGKWIRECCYCHRKGYDPDMPEQISKIEGSLGSYFIRKYFDPIVLDENGLCEQCSKCSKKR